MINRYFYFLWRNPYSHPVSIVPYIVGVYEDIFVPVGKHGEVVMVTFVEDEFHFTRQPAILLVVLKDDVAEVYFHFHGRFRQDAVHRAALETAT